MALTIAIQNRDGTPGVLGDVYMCVAKITFDNSYPTGGLALTAGTLKLPPEATLKYVNVTPATGYVFAFDYTSNKVLAYRSAASGAAMLEVTNGVDLSTIVARCFAIAGV